MIEANTPQFWRATLALSLGSFMIFSNVYVTQPLLPMLAQEFNVSALMAGWSFTITTLMLGLSLLIYGPLSDSLGRRGIMLLSMSGVAVVTLLLSITSSYWPLVILRGLQGLLLGGLPAIAIAYMGDEFTKKGVAVAVGFYISANSLGGISGRLIGGFMGQWFGWSSAFIVMSVLSLICLVLFFRLLPRSAHFEPKPLQFSRMLGDLGGHLRNPALVVAYIIGGFNFFIFVNEYSYVTFLLADAPYNLPASVLGMLFLTYLTGTFASAISGKVAQRISQPWCMAIGIVLLMTGSLLTLAGGLVAIVAGLFINSFGFFFAHSSASSWVSHNATSAKASASSLYLLFYYIGASTGGIYLHPFWQWAGWQGVVFGAILVLMMTLCCALWLARYRQRVLLPRAQLATAEQQ